LEEKVQNYLTATSVIITVTAKYIYILFSIGIAFVVLLLHNNLQISFLKLFQTFLATKSISAHLEALLNGAILFIAHTTGEEFIAGFQQDETVN